MEVWMKMEMCQWILCEVVASPLPECIIGMMSDCRVLLLPSVVEQKAYKLSLQPVLIEHVKWEFTEFLESTQVLDLKQHRITGGEKEIDWNLWQKSMSATQWSSLGVWTRKFPDTASIIDTG